MTQSLFDGDETDVYKKFAARPYQEYVDEVAEIYGCTRQDVIDFLNMERERRGLKPVAYDKLKHDPYINWIEDAEDAEDNDDEDDDNNYNDLSSYELDMAAEKYEEELARLHGEYKPDPEPDTDTDPEPEFDDEPESEDYFEE